MLDVGSVNCDGAASVYGDREKGVLVYVGDGKGGATEAFNDMSYGVTLEGTGPAAKLWLTVSGQSCGKPAGEGLRQRELLRPRDRVECEDAEVRLRACVDGEDGPVGVGDILHCQESVRPDVARGRFSQCLPGSSFTPRRS